jgi:hypothetical protein
MLRRISKTVLLAVSIFGSQAVFAQTKIPNTTQMLMKQKLAAAQGLLEGIVREDFTEIGKHADMLKSISKASTWHTSDSEAFLSYARSFQNATDFLAESAKSRNSEGVALGHVRVTLECIQCHNHVRGAKNKK